MVADLALAFLAGLLSCASACVLPLLPAFVAYIGGLDANRRLAVIGSAGLFVAGFGTAFVAMGTGAALVGSALAAYRAAFVAASGAVLVVVGVALLAGMPFLTRVWRFDIAHRLPRTPLASYVIGLAFAAGWTPCVGPLLAAVLVLAASTATAARGAALLAAYSAGLGLPFVATAAFVAPLTRLVRRVRGAYPALNAVAAILLIGIGALTLTNRLTVLYGFAPQISPVVPALKLGAPPPSGLMADGLVGRSLPSAMVSDVTGHRVSLGGLRGRPLVINFWATWCVPCRQELPVFAEAARAHQAQGLTVVAVNYKEAPGAVRRFWGELGLDLTPYLDGDGAVAQRFGVGLQTSGLPVTFLVDRRGIVRSVLPGQVDPVLLRARLDQLLLE